jgi:hypothetical protein
MMVPLARIAFVAAVIGFLILVAGCATPPPPPPREPVVETKDVGMVVREKCPDRRGPRPDLPDTDDRFTAVDENDPLAVWLLAILYREAIKLYRARDIENEGQISSCVGAPP